MIFLRVRDGRLCHGLQLREDSLRVSPPGGSTGVPKVCVQSEKVFDVGSCEISPLLSGEITL